MNRMREVARWTLTFLIVMNMVFLTACKNENLVESNDKLSVQEQKEINEYRRTDFAMGTVISEIVYASGEDMTESLADVLLGVEHKWISWREKDSEITKINQSAGDGIGVMVSDKTLSFLESALTLAELSEGAFDPTIGKVSRLWDIDGDSPVVPENDQIQKLLQEIGYEKILIDENTVAMESGTELDLGAVGKGFGCDQVQESLEADVSVLGAVISIGGSSILTYGEKPDGSPWKVAVTDPRSESGEYLGTITVDGTHFFSTSGDYEKYFIEDGVRYHHIMDPSTGYSAKSGLLSVTVMSHNGLISDGLSTACFVLGREKSIELLEKYEAQAVFVDEEKNVYMTEGMDQYFELIQEGYQLVTQN